MVEGKMNVVIGGQAGSEAKGKMAAYLVDKFGIGTVAGCLSPNAGHTVWKGGYKVVTHHLPVSLVGGARRVIVGRSSVINPDLFIEECIRVSGMLEAITLDSRAVVITPGHKVEENTTMLDIGSTAQGVGAARRDQLMRKRDLQRVGDIMGFWNQSDILHIYEDTPRLLHTILTFGDTILYEMGQGFDLCLQHGIDPTYCTSKVINSAAAFAESGVSLKHLGHVYGVIRAYPIRVNNRGGTSGPYAEAPEITWGEIALRSGYTTDITETTTTTKLPRRVFEFCWSRFRSFISVCRPDFLCLQFANYLDARDEGVVEKDQLSHRTMEFVKKLEHVGGVPVAYVGTGPDHRQMVDMGVDPIWKEGI